MKVLNSQRGAADSRRYYISSHDKPNQSDKRRAVKTECSKYCTLERHKMIKMHLIATKCNQKVELKGSWWINEWREWSRKPTVVFSALIAAAPSTVQCTGSRVTQVILPFLPPASKQAVLDSLRHMSENRRHLADRKKSFYHYGKK